MNEEMASFVVNLVQVRACLTLSYPSCKIWALDPMKSEGPLCFINIPTGVTGAGQHLHNVLLEHLPLGAETRVGRPVIDVGLA